MANKVVRKSRKMMVVQVPPDELAALTETAHLLRSPKNARRLLSALSRTRVAKDRGGTPLLAAANVDLNGILRLRCCFASRNNNSAQDDKSPKRRRDS